MSPAGGANYIGPSEKAPYACIATCAAVVQFAVYHMPPPGEAPFSVGTVLNVHGAGGNPDFHYQGIVIQGKAGVLTVHFYESISHHACDSTYTYSQCRSMMSRGKMALDPTAGYSRVNMTNVCTGDPVRVRWDNGTHFEATVRKCNSDGTVAVTYLDGAGAKQYAP